jgi:GTP pyrophosphokinase
MSTYSLEEREKIQQAYESMLDDIRPNMPDHSQLQLIDDAYHYCLELYDGKYLISGKAYMFHLIDMARIVVLELGLSYMSVVASFLHGVSYKKAVDETYIESKFGKPIAVILRGFDRISALHTEKVAYNSDNFRDLFLSLVEDIRSVLLKVAHRIYDVRNQEDVDADRLGKYFHEIKYIYIPIVHRLGLYKIKAELEEKLMLFENPEEYRDIAAKIEATKESRQQTVNRFLAPIIQELDRKFDYDITWRMKSIPSIYAKMKAKNVPFEEVFDLLATRVIIDCPVKNEIESCWVAYSIITNLYEPNPERLRDWITKPKASGYESLHTTVKFDDRLWVEVQIRSKRMDEIAETGQAAHYLYKGDKADTEEDWLVNVRYVLENPSMVSMDTSYKNQHKSDKIFIFTPEGDLKKLPVGSTVLDFAYEIHTHVGETCNGAKVNNRVVPIRHVLINGDKVQIMTNKRQSPNADWLNWVTTEKAKSRIRRFLMEEEMKESEQGKELLHRRLKNWKIPVTAETIDSLVREFKTENAMELYHKIATEKIDLADVKRFLKGSK